MSTFLNLISALKYRRCILDFKLQLKNISGHTTGNILAREHSFFESQIHKDESRISVKPLQIEKVES